MSCGMLPPRKFWIKILITIGEVIVDRKLSVEVEMATIVESRPQSRQGIPGPCSVVAE